jgi:hypothetical protein
MLAKYLKDLKKRSEWECVLRSQRDTRLETARKALKSAEVEALKPLHTFKPIEPGAPLLSACAALYDAASRGEPLSHATAVTRGFTPLTGAALHTTLQDAIAAQWVGVTQSGDVYWRDEGLSDACPLVVLAKQFRKPSETEGNE